MYEVYITKNDINEMYYIGVHKVSIDNDQYLGSGIALKKFIKAYGKNHFKRKRLFVFNTKDEAFAKEKEVLKECLHDSNCLNLSEGGYGGPNFKNRKHSNESKMKISKAISGKKTNWIRSQEYRERMSVIAKTRQYHKHFAGRTNS